MAAKKVPYGFFQRIFGKRGVGTGQFVERNHGPNIDKDQILNVGFA
jgi:hypothetical protein